MDDVEFSDEFCRFIQTTIPALGAAELLLVLRRHAEDSFNCEEAIAKLGPGMNAGRALEYLDLFQARGLLTALGAGRYRYRLGNELAGHVDRLERAYSQRPVTLVRAIYALPEDGCREARQCALPR